MQSPMRAHMHSIAAGNAPECAEIRKEMCIPSNNATKMRDTWILEVRVTMAACMFADQ